MTLRRSTASGNVILAAVGPGGVDFAFRSKGDTAYQGLDHVDAVVHTTFSEALTRYADRHLLNIDGTRLFVAVAGAVDRDVTKVTHGRWFISRAGLQAMTGCDPVVVNDVAAMAYAALEVRGRRLFGHQARSDAEIGSRCGLVWAGDALGAACLIGKAAVSVVDSEAGHLPFVPVDPDQTAYAAMHRQGRRALTYEAMISSLQDDLLLNMHGDRNAATLRMQAAVLGQFCASIVLSFASWHTLLVCGPLFDTLEQRRFDQELRDAFDRHLVHRPRAGKTQLLILDSSLAVLRGLLMLDTITGAVN